jgi:pimeloyl-ACP methyl ester carboxylesterase
VKGSVRESFARGRDGTRLYVRERGTAEAHRREGSAESQGTTIVLCDGLMCDGYIWKYAWDDLTRLHRVVHWNYRGHGRSALPADDSMVDIPALASDLHEVRRHIGDPPVVLVGHSMGCQVVLESYRKRPENVVGMVLICGTPGRVTQTFHGSRLLEQVLPRLISATEKHPELIRAVWSRIPVGVSLKIALWTGEVDRHTIRPDDLLPYLAHVQQVDVRLFLRMLRAAGEHSADDLLPRINVPALVIAGDRDTFTPPYLAESMARALPQGSLMMVHGGTHVVPLEQRDLVDRRIERFVLERS